MEGTYHQEKAKQHDRRKMGRRVYPAEKLRELGAETKDKVKAILRTLRYHQCGCDDNNTSNHGSDRMLMARARPAAAAVTITSCRRAIEILRKIRAVLRVPSRRAGLTGLPLKLLGGRRWRQLWIKLRCSLTLHAL